MTGTVALPEATAEEVAEATAEELAEPEVMAEELAVEDALLEEELELVATAQYLSLE
jgi:hypothetical protein